MVHIQCSNCGRIDHMSNKRVNIEGLIYFIREGWGSCGSALYCPDCSATWFERNTHKQDDNDKTLDLIYEIYKKDQMDMDLD